jgi:hypothetical protein
VIMPTGQWRRGLSSACQHMLNDARRTLVALEERWPSQLRFTGSAQHLINQTKSLDAPEAFADAWTEIRQHPALQWVPPIWRSASENQASRKYAINAIDRNLVIDVVNADNGSAQVRLTTGPLVDREVGDGVDATTPAATFDPRLDVQAETFEAAVLRLRDALVANYGPTQTPSAAPAAFGRNSDRSPFVSEGSGREESGRFNRLHLLRRQDHP